MITFRSLSCKRVLGHKHGPEVISRSFRERERQEVQAQLGEQEPQWLQGEVGQELRAGVPTQPLEPEPDLSAAQPWYSMKRGHVATNLSRLSVLTEARGPCQLQETLAQKWQYRVMLWGENCGSGRHTVPSPGCSRKAG